MTERNPYSPYNNSYDSFDQPQPTHGRMPLRERIASSVSNPVFALAALLLTGAAFAAIVISSYPKSAVDGTVPVIQADAGDLRQEPDQAGGMQVAHQDSTVYTVIRSGELPEAAPVENLLENEQPVDKIAALAKQADTMFAADKDEPSAGAPSEITENMDAPPSEEAAAAQEAPSQDSLPGVKTVKITQQVEKIPPKIETPEALSKHRAGSSPETLAFVRSVLDEKDGKPPTAGASGTAETVNTQADVTQPAAAQIEPAAGAASAPKTVAKGNYYVQVGSVTSESGASMQWNKIQKDFGSALQGLQYRVQRADLPTGTRYRIQAGPMAKDDAATICNALKAQKPGAASLLSNGFAAGAENALAAIFSLAGPELTKREELFFRDANPFGFILFNKPGQRNIENPEQLKKLTAKLKKTLRRDCPILIDQEGGRVQRLRPPQWRQYPPMQTFGELAETDMEAALESLRFTMLQLGEELHDMGFNVNCAPCIDVLQPETHDVIGDRAFSSNPEIVSRLGLSVCRNLLAAGITPVIKHMPGHGRATSDSHKTLPVVKASASELLATDFKPFKDLAKSDVAPAIWGMPTPVLYPALDPDHAACASPKIINDIIRGEMGFEGILVSDALDMDGFAAYGDAAGRVGAVLKAGCDIALYCTGKLQEMEKIANSVPKLTPAALKRLQKAAEFRKLAA